MRYALAAALVLGLTAVAVPARADDPLICVETGEVWVEPVIRYDPPDPCLL